MVDPKKSEQLEFTKEEVDLMKEVFEAKKNIYAKTKDKIVPELINLVDNTEGISFSSDINRKFIDKRHPLLKLQYNLEEVKKKHSIIVSGEVKDREEFFIKEYLYLNIISKFTEFLFGEIEEDKDVSEILNRIKLKLNLTSVNNFVFSSLSSIEVNTEKKQVYIKILF